MNWKKLASQLLFMALFGSGILMLVHGTALYFIGFHNADLGQNMRYLETELGINLTDRTNQGGSITGMQAYNLGSEQQRFAVWQCIAGAFLLGIYFAVTMKDV